MGSVWRLAGGGLSAMVAAATLSACSSNPPAATSTTTTRPPSTTASTTTGTATTTTTTTSTTTSSTATSSSTPAGTSTTTCQLPALRVADAGQGAAAGTQEVTFSLTNTSATACTTFGYPGLLLVSSAGGSLPTKVDRGGGLAFESIAPSTVTIAPGKAAYFNVGFSDVTVGTTTCSTTRTVEVTPPTNTTHAAVDVTLGIDACDGGTLHASAVFSSTDSAATQTTAPSSSP